MDQEAYVLDPAHRAVVFKEIREVCEHRAWMLLAAPVRTNHVHVVVDSDAAPEKVMNDLKVYASRRLNDLGLDDAGGRKRWARYGSTRWLWDDRSVQEAIRYVTEGQGEPMERCEAELP
jgi:REP element-mobilizing transposase RayT